MVVVGSDSPWGRVEWAKELVTGVVMVSTPSHGGAWVSQERCAEMPAELARVPTFVERSCGKMPVAHGGRWYEEDCDMALVALAWPELFPREFLPVARLIGGRASPHVAMWLDRLPADHPVRGGVEPAAGSSEFQLMGSDRPADAPGQGNLL